VISAKSQALARELLFAVTRHSTSLNVRDKQLSTDKVEQLLQVATQIDEAYKATIIEESDDIPRSAPLSRVENEVVLIAG
jgi:hypothetical protein